MRFISVHLILVLGTCTCAISLQKISLDNYIIAMRMLKMIINVFKWDFKKNVSRWEHRPPPGQHRCLRLSHLRLSHLCSSCSWVARSVSSVTKATFSGWGSHSGCGPHLIGVQQIPRRCLHLAHFPLTLPFSQWHDLFSPSPSVEASASFFQSWLSFLIAQFLSSRTEPPGSCRSWGWPEWPRPLSPLIMSHYQPLISLPFRSFFYLRWFLFWSQSPRLPPWVLCFPPSK